MFASRYVDRRRYDAVIVGGGVYGSLMAKRLGERGWQVLVLEAGTGTSAPWEGYTASVSEFHTSLKKTANSPYLDNPAAPSPDNTDPHGYFVQKTGQPYASDYLRTLGGAMLHWEGVVPRMHEQDFLTHTLYGKGLDWPFPTQGAGANTTLTPEIREEIGDYYRQVEFELGVAGDAEKLKNSGLHVPGYVYPMKPLPQSYLDKTIASRLKSASTVVDLAETKLTPTLVPAPQARNSDPNPAYDNHHGYRPQGTVGLPNFGERCVGNSSCIPICPPQAKYTPLRTQSQFDHQHVTVATHSIVTKVIFNETGRATGVEYKVYDDPRSTAATIHTVDADIVILAAHAIENAKLLLASDVKNPLVGKHLMDHPVVVLQGLMDTAIGPHRGPPATSFIDTFREGPWRKDLASFRIAVFNWGWAVKGHTVAQVERMIDTGSLHRQTDSIAREPVVGRALHDALADHLPRKFQFDCMLEQTADPANTVTIDRAHRDRFGTFRPVLHYSIDTYVEKGALEAVRIGQQLFKAIGATEEHRNQLPAATRQGDDAVIKNIQAGEFHYDILGARHGAGTHVMGRTAATSVVDPHQRVHGHPNLFAVGCGSMPPSAPPTPPSPAPPWRCAPPMPSTMTCTR